MRDSRNDSVLVSVVIPAFNEERTVGGVVERACGVLEELALPYEVIVVDDVSITLQVAVFRKVYFVGSYSLSDDGVCRRKWS